MRRQPWSSQSGAKKRAPLMTVSPTLVARTYMLSSSGPGPPSQVDRPTQVAVLDMLDHLCVDLGDRPADQPDTVQVDLGPGAPVHGHGRQGGKGYAGL